MMKMMRKFTGFLLLGALATTTLAQTPDEHILLTRLEKHFSRMDSIVLLPESKQICSLKWSYSLPTEVSMDSALTSLSLSRMKELSSATGLKWVGQVYVRPDKQLGLDEEDGAVSRYVGKIQSEVRWDFFHSGLYQRKTQAQSVALQEAIDRQKYGKDQYEQWADEQKESLSAYYDVLLSGVLSYRLANLELLAEVRNYMYANEMTGSELLLNLLNEKSDSERRYEMLHSSSVELLKSASVNGLVVLPPPCTYVKIDTISLFNQVRQTNRDAEILRLRMRLLDNQVKRSGYLSTTSVSPFLRYSRYYRSRNATSENVDVGVTFTLPLSLESKRKRQTLRSEHGVLALQLDEQRKQVEQEVRRLVTSVDRLNRMIEGEHKRMGEAKEYIDMRSKAYARQYGDYNALSRIKEYDNYFSCWEKLLNDYYQRDCLLVDLQEFLVDVPVGNFSK